MRLVSGILAGQKGRFVLTGDESLSRRPQERIAEPLREMGARVETKDGGAPVLIEGGALTADPLRAADGERAGEVGRAPRRAVRRRRPDDGRRAGSRSRDHTERLLRERAWRCERRGADVSVEPVQRIAPFRVEIAGDFSTAAPFIVAATLLHGSELLVEGVNVNPLRTGLLDVLERMGANIASSTGGRRRRAGGGPRGAPGRARRDRIVRRRRCRR